MNARIAAPELPELEWVNTDDPPALEQLRGRVTLLYFWTFDCVNCINALPDVRYLENKYHDGLSVIGVHTPKYAAQRSVASVLKAVNRNHVRYAVANDPGFTLWQAYGVQSWPTLAVIDAQGQLAALLPGEGRRQEADTLIAHLLDEAAASDLRVYESGVSVARHEARTPLSFPGKLLVTDSALWIADSGHNRILECDHEGRILRQIGSGNPGYWDGRGADGVRLLNAEVETLVGTGELGRDIPHDYSQPTKVAMSAPMDVAAIGDYLYIAVSGQNQIWQLDLNANQLSVLAGNGQLALTDGEGMLAGFAQPGSLSVIGQQLAIADTASSSIRLLRLLDKRVTTLIGAGLYDFGDVNGKRDVARLQHPMAVAADPRGLIFVADTYNGKIKALNMRSGEVRTLNMPYRFEEPSGLSLAAGALWIANTNAHEIVRVDLSSGKMKRLSIGE